MKRQINGTIQTMILCGICLLVVMGASASQIQNHIQTTAISYHDDFDPLINIEVTVTIKTIRSLEKYDQQVHSIKRIDLLSKPDLYVKVYINNQEFTSPVWRNTRYIYTPDWSATLDVPDDTEWVNVRIELWDRQLLFDKQCDLSGLNTNELLDSRGVNLTYSIKTGHWYGDDNNNPVHINWWMLPDESGYGRLNGCDDRSFYQQDLDCELWFDINQNDYDGDGIPYWAETMVTLTDPTVDNRGIDADGDGCPLEWEYKWGHYFIRQWHSNNFSHAWAFNDSQYDAHRNLDPDQDGLSNYEEYLTSQWGSDPFRKDLFVELDQMLGPDGVPLVFPEAAKELIYTAFNRRNIIFHLDDGRWVGTGSDNLPYQTETSYQQLNELYQQYFLHFDQNNWRSGVFHYGILVYNCTIAGGNAFGSNRFQISAKFLEEKAALPLLRRDIVYASAYMHETGHTLGLEPLGGHDENSKYPWQLGWWKWRPYKSCMNYGYMYRMVDYSDGSRGKNDFNDWSSDRMDLTAFQQGTW
ncbi:MAG: hypothetical protein QXL17_02010 [Candidatus Thermoplasmatota archaeon]